MRKYKRNKILYLADYNFPSPKANLVQMLNASNALARTGNRVKLLIRGAASNCGKERDYLVESLEQIDLALVLDESVIQDLGKRGHRNDLDFFQSLFGEDDVLHIGFGDNHFIEAGGDGGLYL